jgi:hypothetical protein
VERCGLDGMHLDQNREQWQTIVNTVMNLHIPKKADNFLTNCCHVCSCQLTTNISCLVPWNVYSLFLYKVSYS